MRVCRRPRLWGIPFVDLAGNGDFAHSVEVVGIHGEYEDFDAAEAAFHPGVVDKVVD
jgi:hypothetical protein